MGLVQRLGEIEQSVETRRAASAFCKVARLLALHHGNVREALASPEGQRSTDTIKRVLGSAGTKAAVVPGSTETGNWAAALAEFTTLSQAFSASLQYASAFDRILNDGGALRIPLRTRVVTITTAAVGSQVAQLTPKPISQMSLNGAEIEPVKVVCTHAVSEELVRLGTPDAVAFFDAGLRRAVAVASDTAFLAGILVGVTPTPSAGVTFANWQTDLAALLAAVDIGPDSRVYLVMHPDRLKSYVVLTNTNSGYAFPQLTLQGGPITAGIEVLVSDRVPTGRMILIVADGLMMSSDVITLHASNQALLQMETSPDSPATSSTTMVSLFQQGLVAIRAERALAFYVGRSRSIAALSY